MDPPSPLFTLNPLNAELNPICNLLALLGGATIVVVSRLRVKNTTGIMNLKIIQFQVKMFHTSHSWTRTQTQYILGQHDSSINIQII